MRWLLKYSAGIILQGYYYFLNVYNVVELGAEIWRPT